ncbi:MAG: hypothetical protein ACRDNZ_16955, partial [Streptosporangiaceae bacterium]
MRGFPALHIRGDFGPDHWQGHAEGDVAIDLAAATGELVVGVPDDDLVTEEPCRAGAGMGDQGLALGQFQLEVITQERGEAGLDLLGPGFGPGEPEQVIVGLCRGPGYADRTAGWPAWRAGCRSGSGITRWSWRVYRLSRNA